MRLVRLKESGDTLVEVLLATAVLSMVLAGAFTLTNRATRLTQTANERTDVSNLMQSQAELLRASHSRSSDELWQTIDNYPLVGSLDVGGENPTFCEASSSPTDPNRSFYLTSDLSLQLTNRLGAFTDGVDDLYDVWIEAANHSPSGSGPIEYTDFFVYACWEGIGGEVQQRSGLVMRLSRL